MPTAGSSAATSVLRTGHRLERARRENGAEIVALPDDRRRHAVRGEPEQARLRARGPTDEARSVDPDDGDEPARAIARICAKPAGSVVAVTTASSPLASHA